MDLDNQLPVLLISLYLLIIYIVLYKKYKFFKQTHKSNIIDLKKFDKTMILYINNDNTIKELFFTTFNKLKKLKFKNQDLLSYEIIVNDYVNNLNNKSISTEELEEVIDNDLTFYQVQSLFYSKLKEETKKIVGNVDFSSENILAVIICFPYFMGVLYSIYNEFSLNVLIMISMLLSLLSLVIINKIRYKKIYLRTFLKSNILAFIASYIWIKNSNVNYILFHAILAILAFMYPLLLTIVKYALRTNTRFLNNMQMNVIMELLRKDKI